MKPDLTLKHLADLGAEAAFKALCAAHGDCGILSVREASPDYPLDAPAREAFVKAVLDAIGYQFPVDPEREAYEKWFSSHPSPEPYDAWKAGREELRKQSGPVNGPNTKTEPAWIEWKGGPCPIPDTVKRWEYKLDDGRGRPAYSMPSNYKDNWEHAEDCDRMYRITAYRVLDWGNTPETFEAHGHTWFKHKPGDPMPCEGGRRVFLLFRDEEAVLILNGLYVGWTRNEGKSSDIIGWRYAE